MLNQSQKLMHHFDDLPCELNPHALDESFSANNTFTNYIVSPQQILNSEAQPQQQLQQPLQQTLQVNRRKSVFPQIKLKSTKVIPESYTMFLAQSKNNQVPEIKLNDKVTKQEINPSTLGVRFKNSNSKSFRNSPPKKTDDMTAQTAQMDDFLTSPVGGQLTSGILNSATDSLLNVHLLSDKKPRPNALMVYYLIKRFMTKISITRRQKLFFKAKHFDIVNDKASENILSLSELHSNNMQNNGLLSWFGGKYFRQCVSQYVRFKNRLITNLAKIMRHIPLIYPQSMGKIIWDIVLCVILMYFFVMIPIEICFENSFLFVEYPLTVLFIIFLLSDYLLKMNTVYYEYGKPVTDRMKIFQLNMQNGYLIDGISITVLFIATFYNFSTYSNSNILNLILLLFYTQFRHFKTIVKHAEESMNFSKVVQSVFDLIKLIFTILFVEHIFSCLWYWIAMYKQRQNEINWLAESGLLHESWGIQYLVSFYFSTVTMLSVGYGDIVPTNSLERFICIFFMLFACMQLSYSVNTVGQIINSLSLSQDEDKGKMRVINKYMNDNMVSFGLQYEVREYLKIYWQQQVAQESQEEERILINLSEGLRNKLIFEANNSVLRSCPLFQKHFSEETKVKLLKVMKQVVITPETVITSQINQIGEPCLCFVQLGELDVCLNQQSQLGIGSFSKGMHFGLEDFITGQTPLIQLSSQAFVKLIVITRSDFLKEINEHPHDFEEFCMIKDQYMFQTIVEEDKCFSCQCSGHDIFKCPLVHFVIDKEKIIKSNQFYKKQSALAFNRSSKRQKNQFSALCDQWAIQEISQILQNQEGDLCYYYDKVNQLYQENLDQEGYLSIIDSKTNKKVKQKQKRKFTFVQTDAVPIIKKFQRVVRRVIHMMMMTGAKKFAINPPSAISKSRIEIQKFNANLFFQLKKLKDEEGDVQLHKSLRQKELNDIHFLILKMNLINIQDYSQLILFSSKFESQKDFLLYSPHNNLNKVIEIYDQSESLMEIKQWFNQHPSIKNTALRQQILRVSLTKYMIFPYDYFKKFCKQEQNKLAQKTKQTKVTNAKKLFQKFKMKNQEQRLKLRNLKSKLKLQPLANQSAGTMAQQQ